MCWSTLTGGFRSFTNVARDFVLGRTPAPPPPPPPPQEGVHGSSDLEFPLAQLHDSSVPRITFGHAHPYAIGSRPGLYKATLWENAVVVMRRIPLRDENANETTKHHGLLALLDARHVNLCHYVGTCEVQGSLCIVSAFIAGGDLGTHIAARPNCDRRALLAQVAQGLSYLHQSGIIHGNLHPRNVLLSNGIVKISDFGIAGLIPADGATSIASAFSRKKAMHRAPETHMHNTLSSSADVYSFAMLVFHAYCDKEPMIDQYPDTLQVVAALASGLRPLRNEIVRSDFSDNLWVAVQRSWAKEAEKKLPMSVVVEALSNDMPAAV